MKRTHPVLRCVSSARRRTLLATTLAAGIAASFSACTVGPNYQAPQADVPTQWHDTQQAATAASASGTSMSTPNGASGVPGAAPTAPASAAAATEASDARVTSTPTVDSDPDPRWWRSFNDPTLDSLVTRAVASNPDLQQAVLRIAQARLQTAQTAAQGLPNLRASGSFEREQEGIKGILQEEGVYNQVDKLGSNATINGFSPGAGATVQNSANQLLDSITSPINVWQVGFDASWELDLFGRVRRSVEASEAQTQAAIENQHDALLSLEAEVAQTYAQLRGAQAVRAIAVSLVDQQREIVELTQSQAKVGLASQLDVRSAAAQLATTQAGLPQYDQQIEQAMNGLAYLLGEAPGSLDAELSAPAAVPPVPPQVPIGLPSTLARRRPDIRAAEANLHAATASVGVAVAQFYPDITLSGEVGTRALNASDLSHWSHLFYSFGPQISLPIFQGGSLVANLKLSKVQQANAALAYRKAVLGALRDVDNALAVYRTDQARHAALDDSVREQQQAFDLARDSYKKGIVTYINVLDAERQLAQDREQAEQANAQVTTDLVALYKALGGGWQDDTSAAASR